MGRGRARKDHRADGAELDEWLLQEVVPFDQNAQRLTEAVFDWCRDHCIKPPSPNRIERRIRSLIHRHETEFFDAIASKLPDETRARLDSLLQPFTSASANEEPGVVATPFSQLKTDPGPVGLNSVKNNRLLTCDRD